MKKTMKKLIPLRRWRRRPVTQEGAGGARPRSGQAAGGGRLRQVARVEREMDFSDQERIFGTLLGSVPNIRAKTNGVVIYKGYVVAEFGDTTWRRSDLLGREEHAGHGAGIAVRDGLITNLDAPVGARSRTAATTRRATRRSPGSITCSRRASGKATCGASRTTSSARKRSATAR